MQKYLFILIMCFIAFSSKAEQQTQQQIIEFCKETYEGAGNLLILNCIKNELKAQKEIQELEKASG
jgi:hypothetical protein